MKVSLLTIHRHNLGYELPGLIGQRWKLGSIKQFSHPVPDATKFKQVDVAHRWNAGPPRVVRNAMSLFTDSL